jgi:hypothetical protein
VAARSTVDHTPGRLQSWTDLDHDVRLTVDSIVDACRRHLGGRALQLLRKGPATVSSKIDGARWALAGGLVSQHHAVVADALACYLSTARVSAHDRLRHGHDWDEASLLDLAAFARREVFGR